jgi:hypothetical protein
MERSLTDTFSSIADAVQPSGLIVRGALNFSALATPGLAGSTARSVVLIGNAGGQYWQQFQVWQAQQPTDLSTPLDTWSRSVLEEAAAPFGGRVIMPNDKPYAPFQQWAMRAEGLRPSPVGLLIHPVYGLWHAFRGAILLDAEVSIQAAHDLNHPCDTCVGKPCLNSCPVDAFAQGSFAYGRCREHVRSANAGPCRTGCLARNACPVGTDFRYPAPVQAFHQRAFAGL